MYDKNCKYSLFTLFLKPLRMAVAAGISSSRDALWKYRVNEFQCSKTLFTTT